MFKDDISSQWEDSGAVSSEFVFESITDSVIDEFCASIIFQMEESGFTEIEVTPSQDANGFFQGVITGFKDGQKVSGTFSMSPLPS